MGRDGQKATVPLHRAEAPGGSLGPKVHREKGSGHCRRGSWQEVGGASSP